MIAFNQAFSLLKTGPGYGARPPKMRQCRECSKVSYRTGGVCNLSQGAPVAGIPNLCKGGLRVVRYPTDEQIQEADDWRGSRL